MFTELFCNCILYPGVFEGVKLGTGKVWEKIYSGSVVKTKI